jgi:pyruvate formate lyase activating enzyme
MERSDDGGAMLLAEPLCADPQPHRRIGTAPTGSLHSWDIVTGTDGPGTRFVAFLAGCPLRCLYCHNPDTQSRRAGRKITVEELLGRVEGFHRFLEASGGGVTVSGGEPLVQARFVEAFLGECKAAGLHTALDTSGYLGARAGDALLDATDLVLLDIKSSDPATYRRVTGRSLSPTVDFARRLARHAVRTWVRFVLVPGLTDDPANVAGVADIVAGLGNVERVEVLGYHRLGVTKYAELGLRYPLDGVEPPTAAQLAAAAAPFAERGLTVLTV